MTYSARTRIGWITIKATGTKVRFLPHAETHGRAEAESRAIDLIRGFDQTIAGMAITVWAPDNSCRHEWLITELSKIPRWLLPDFVAAAMRESITMQAAVEWLYPDDDDPGIAS
jgi:hypothetical protein